MVLYNVIIFLLYGSPPHFEFPTMSCTMSCTHDIVTLVRLVARTTRTLGVRAAWTRCDQTFGPESDPGPEVHVWLACKLTVVLVVRIIMLCVCPEHCAGVLVIL